ncbi:MULTISPECIES: hypothetical protein [Mesorhizobium]|uniref:hypothetical protein n=1 Tax=Mesorhizobium TaxID=68287 RepID=UPI0002F19B76|nr:MULTISPECIES: hypothetical protein [Mesorhizobium]
MANQLSGALVLLEAEIVENDDVDGRQSGASFDAALEDGGIGPETASPAAS